MRPEVQPAQPHTPDHGERLAVPDFESTPEGGVESVPDSSRDGMGPEGASASTAAGTTDLSQARPVSPHQEKVEMIMEEGLGDLYASMTAQQQTKFKEEGEEAASKISALLTETKVKVKKIVDILRDWLKLIPGVNKYFLEQEAKLKADKIIDITEESSTPDQDKNKI